MPSDGSWKSERLQHGARRIHCYRLARMKIALLCVVLVCSFCRWAFAAGGTVIVSTPRGGSVTNIPAGLTNVVAVAAGLDDALALRDDGTVVAWGANDFGITNVPP